MASVRVLELRIHGIANSPPADMLCTTSEEVERKDGDDQGSFWQIKPKTPGTAHTSSTGVETVAEAYSWGNQARSGGSALALVGRAIVHVCWLFVLPFGLSNLAYWARRDIKGTDEDPKWWAGGDGAVAVRVFALLQTLFYTVGFLTVFVQLMGLKCFRVVEALDGGTEYQACAALPNWLDFLAQWSPTARAALFSLAPIAVILLIYVIGRRARGMFNPQRSFDDDARGRRRSRGKPAGEAAPPRPALLASPGFWHRSRVAQTSERAHLAGAIALTVLLLAADAFVDSFPGEGPLDVLFGGGRTATANPVPFTLTVVASVLVVGTIAITAAAGLSGKIWSTRSKRGWSTVLLVLSTVAYLVWLWWAILVSRNNDAGVTAADADSLRGLVVAPTVIAAGGALIAVASLSWGYRWRRRLVMWFVLPLAFVCAIVSALWATNRAGDLAWVRPALSWITVLLVLSAIVIAYLPFRDPEVREARRLSGWHGNGSSVCLLLALLASLVITSLFVLGTHAWLTTDTDPPQVKDGWRTVEQSTTEPIAAPTFHERFGGMLVVILIVFILFALVTVIASLRRFPAFSLPGPEFDPDLGGTRLLVTDPAEIPAALTASAGAHPPRVVLEKDYPPNEEKPSGRLRAIADARRVAGLLHRGEPLLRVLAILSALSLFPLAIPYFGELLQQLAIWDTLASVSRWALGLLALASVAWVVTNAVTSTERPLGLVWDIICFFPRAGHPFTPPCYAERAVPEIIKRIKRWTREEGDDAHVILSAHSMGATIAVGAILSLHGEEQDEILGRVSLLTHGVQLRPYFSRFFPEVFGARILGVRGTRGPSMLGADPWRQQVLDDNRRTIPLERKGGDPASVVQLLGGDFHDDARPVAPRWRSLWRRSDYLGFPVTGYWSNEKDGVNENPIDRGATERSPRSYLWAVARHNDYLSTAQYRSARDELIEVMKQGRQKPSVSDAEARPPSGSPGSPGYEGR